MITLKVDIYGETETVVNKMMAETGQDIQAMFRSALGLYQLAFDAVAEGKVVGVAATEDAPLETIFMGIRGNA